MDAFPAFVPLRGVRVVVAGQGDTAEAKARLFAGSPAEVIRITGPAAALDPASYAGARLAFIALAEPHAAAAAARAAGAWVNVVDQPALCDFHTPSIVDRGAVVGAIGTAGAAPLLASRLRTEWEARWPEGLGRLAELLSRMRGPVRDRFADMRERRSALLRLLDGPAGALALTGDLDAALVLAAEGLSVPAPPEGRIVQLAAPRDPEDLTLRDLRALARADRIVGGADVSPSILAHARRDAIRLDGVDEATLESWAGAGETVVVISASTPSRMSSNPTA